MFWRKVCILLIDHGLWSIKWEKPSWPWSYASWVHNYPCNQCLSPLMLWFRISIRARCTPSNKQTNKQTINKMRNITHHQNSPIEISPKQKQHRYLWHTYTLYNIIRNYIFRHISNICHNCNDVSKNSKLIWLLVKETFSFMETLGSFIGRCFNIRY